MSTTFPALLRSAAAEVPDREALVTPTARLSFADLLAQVQVFSSAALQAGIRRGDRVAVWGPNTADTYSTK